MRWSVAMAATVAAAAILRFAGLGSGLWYDEMVTLVESARKPFVEILVTFPDVNVHPLYSLLAHASLATFGESAWSLRLPACLFGIASVAMVYVLGRRFTDRAEAWAGATVLAASYHHIWFSQNARGYTLMGFFALVSTYYVLRLPHSGKTRDYVLYVLASAAGVYTHLTMAFVVAGHAAVIAGGKLIKWSDVDAYRLRSLTAAWAAAALLSIALYLPYADSLLAHFGAPEPPVAAKVATGSWAVLETIRNLLFGSGVLGAVLAAIVAAAGAISLWRDRRLLLALLVAPAIVTATVLFGMGQPVRPRFFFFLAGAAAICAGRGLGAAARRFTASRESAAPILACTAVLVGVAAIALPRNYRVPKQDLDGAVRYLDERAAQGAVIGAAGPACYPVERYYQKTGWPCLRTDADLQALLATSSPVLVVHTLTVYIEDAALLERLNTACREVRRFPGTLGGGDVVVCDPRMAGQP